MQGAIGELIFYFKHKKKEIIKKISSSHELITITNTGELRQ